MRTLTAGFRDEIEASQSSEIAIIFATITHPDLDVAIRVNSDIVNYSYGGETFVGAGFSISLLSDDDQPPQAKVAIHNVSRVIGETVLALSTSPRIKLEIFARSDWDNANPRIPISTPAVEYSAPDLFLRNVSCDALQLTADIFSFDIATEPWPSIRSTPDRLPALFR